MVATLKQKITDLEFERLGEENKAKYIKKFMGKEADFADKNEEKKEAIHLKAFNKGEERFSYGKNNFGNKIYHKVLFEYVLKDKK